MVNKYLALGYLSSDPESKTFSSGKIKTNFSIGINYGKDTTWIEVECWDKIAENAKSFLKKGSLVFIDGKMKTLSWKDKNGFSKSKLICVCDFFKTIQQKNKEDTHSVNDILKESLEDDIALQKDLENIPW